MAIRPILLAALALGCALPGEALDAAARGLKVVLLESHDFAKGTSSRSTKLVETLDTYFRTGGNLTRTSTELHVHVNTVTQRLERVSRLLGESWQQPERQLEVQRSRSALGVRAALTAYLPARQQAMAAGLEGQPHVAFARQQAGFDRNGSCLSCQQLEAPLSFGDRSAMATARAATSSGSCRAVDGDTLRCGRERIRLLGIDAPELPGHCQRGRQCVPGDPVASRASLARALTGRLSIKRLGTDHYGRTLALVRGARGDLSCWQLRNRQARYRADWDNGRALARRCRRAGTRAPASRPPPTRGRPRAGSRTSSSRCRTGSSGSRGSSRPCRPRSTTRTRRAR